MLPSKIQMIEDHLPRKGGKVLVPQEWQMSEAVASRCPKVSLHATGEDGKGRGYDFDAAVFQYTGRDPREALSALQEVILRLKPGSVLIVDGYVRQRSLMRVANKAVTPAVGAACTLLMAEEIVQQDFEAGDGIWVGRTSK